MYNIDKRYSEIKLFFEEKAHKYNDSLGNPYTSVTTLIHKYQPEFNRSYWLRKKAKELGLTEKQVAQNWKDITDESCARGNNTHNFLEDNIKEVSQFAKAVKYLHAKDGQMFTLADLNAINVQPLDINVFREATNNKYPEIYRVFEYYTNLGYTIYSEIGMFLIDYLVSGTIDILCIRPTDFVILDWKTNKDGLQFDSGYFRKDKTIKPHQLTNEWINKNETLKAPVSNLPNCNGSIYSLQLSLYAMGVHLITGLPCNGLGLCHIASPFILNKYGMPLKDAKGMYTIDETKEEVAAWHRIKFYHKEAMAILNDHRINLGGNINKQYSLGL